MEFNGSGQMPQYPRALIKTRPTFIAMVLILRSFFLLVGLILTYITVFWPIELMFKEMCRSECTCAAFGIRETKESGRAIFSESPVAPEYTDDGEKVRILIWVLTGPSRHMTHALHVKRTWGAHFDKLLFMSSEEDENLGTIVLPNVKEGHEKLWPKTQKAFQYVWKHHKDDADWFMKADDDTFVVSHNLHAFLKDLNPDEPHYFGYVLNNADLPMPVNYGGTGYILSRAALRLLIKALKRGKGCHTKIRKKYHGDEDTELGICMATMNVPAGAAADADGRDQMVMVDAIDNFDNVVANFNGSWPLENREWSSKAISFHSVSLSQMYLLDHLIYKMKMF